MHGNAPPPLKVVFGFVSALSPDGGRCGGRVDEHIQAMRTQMVVPFQTE